MTDNEIRIEFGFWKPVIFIIALVSLSVFVGYIWGFNNGFFDGAAAVICKHNG